MKPIPEFFQLCGIALLLAIAGAVLFILFAILVTLVTPQ